MDEPREGQGSWSFVPLPQWWATSRARAAPTLTEALALKQQVAQQASQFKVALQSGEEQRKQLAAKHAEMESKVAEQQAPSPLLQNIMAELIACVFASNPPRPLPKLKSSNLAPGDPGLPRGGVPFSTA